MTRRLTCFIFVLLMFAADLRAQSEAPDCDHELTGQKRLDLIVRLRIDYRDADDDSIRQSHDLNCAMTQWQHRDGAIGPAVSDTFLSMLQSNPQAFFDFMATHRPAFEEWLAKITTLSFVWYLPPPSPLDRKRTELISNLSEAKITGPTQQNMRDQLVRRLRAVTPRQVD